MKINIELIEDGVMPFKKNTTDVAFDCVIRKAEQLSRSLVKYYLGFKIEVPIGYGAFIYPRSSIKDYDLVLSNHVGIIDPLFGNEVTAYFRITNKDTPKIYWVGERCCQMVIRKLDEIELVNTTISTDNVREGYGSTGL